MSVMCVYRCRQFVDINCRLHLYILEAKKKNQKKYPIKKIPSLSDKAHFWSNTLYSTYS